MATPPVSQTPSPFYPRHSAPSLPPSLHHSRSSSVESRPRGRTTYSHNRTPSQDSLYPSLDNPCGPIQRWDGLSREATEWNSLRRDPELYLPVGNCLVFLYAAGSSRRGPSFRIPYDLLLYSGCRPLIDRCLMSTSTSEYHPASPTPPSYETVDYTMSSEANCSLVYLPAPAGLSRDESYAYHLTTRNFFAWLLGVPLVGTDPVSALLDLKLRMDVWRDPGSCNFGALFDYVKEQGYGDLEALEIEMGNRLTADTNQAYGTMGFAPTNPTNFNDQSRPNDEGERSRRNSITERIKKKLSRSRVRGEERQAQTISGRNDFEARVQTLRMNNHSQGPPPPSANHISAAMQRLVDPPNTQSVDTTLNAPNRKEEETKKRRSWTNIAGNAWKRKSMTDARLPSLHTQQPQSVWSPALEQRYSPATEQQISEPTPAVAEKKKRCLSCERASLTDIKLPAAQAQQAQSAISSAINRPPSAPAPASAPTTQSAPRSASVSAVPKKKQRLSWASVSDKIFDIMMPPMSKDDILLKKSQAQGGDPSLTNTPSELPATEVARPLASSSQTIADRVPEAEPTASTSAGAGATGSSSRHPTIHDFSTGKEICACCGKVRQPRPPSDAGPSQLPPTEREDVKDNRRAFDFLHDHMKNGRNKSKSRSHKVIIVPEYGNGSRGRVMDSGKGKARAIGPAISAVKMPPEKKRRNLDSQKSKTGSIDAIISPVHVRSSDTGRVNTQSIGKSLSGSAILGPVDARTNELRKPGAKLVKAVIQPAKVQHETSLPGPAGPTLAAELVASPTSIPESGASPSRLGFASLRAYRRSSQPAGMDQGQRARPEATPRVVKAESGRRRLDDINDVHSRVTNPGRPAIDHGYGSDCARVVTEGPNQDRDLEEGKPRIVDTDFESNIADLLSQLEAAGISETKTETGNDKRKSLVSIEQRMGMPRLVYEVA